MSGGANCRRSGAGRWSCSHETPPFRVSGGRWSACTTTVRGIPTEVLLEPPDDPVPLVSVVNLDSVESVSVGTPVERLGRLGHERMRQICEALAVAIDCQA